MNATPILLVPGLNATARVFAGQIETLWRHGPVTIANHTRGGSVAEIAASILADAPPRFALVGFSMGGYVAQELALRCLFDQVEIIQDLYGLDLQDGWRSRLEQHMLEDTDSEMLYQNAMDGFEGDVELNMQLGLAPMKVEDWFEPFNDASVPPYVR